MILELVAAAVLLMVGVVSAARSLLQPAAAEDGRSRLLLAVHDTAKAGFWLSLGTFFLVYGLAEEPQAVRWLALLPVVMAGLRLAAWTLLSRG